MYCNFFEDYEEKERKRALFYGLLGAFIFRFASLFLISFISISINTPYKTKTLLERTAHTKTTANLCGSSLYTFSSYARKCMYRYPQAGLLTP